MDYVNSYLNFFKKLKTAKESDSTLYSKAVGGDYENMGYLQWQLLKYAGMKPRHHLVDVGCGTGRLASQLAKNGHRNIAVSMWLENSWTRQKQNAQGGDIDSNKFQEQEFR
jgi:2-polyprenyl-3-methyl-5-hydroxy-6-metoxy-1,4-benzoquinol methylase